MWGQDASLERLRVDRQFEGALTHGLDPLHHAEVFRLDEKIAMRYAHSAKPCRNGPPNGTLDEIRSTWPGTVRGIMDE